MPNITEITNGYITVLDIGNINLFQGSIVRFSIKLQYSRL